MDEPERLDAVALVRAHLAGDEQRVFAVLAPLNPMALFAVTVGLLVDDLLAQSWPGGLASLDEHLAGLQQNGGEAR
jgi:hypothetical protein